LVRRVRVAGREAPVAEQLLALDEEVRMISYAIVEGGLPALSNYMATATVTATETGCEIRWECRARTPDPSLLEAMAAGLVAVFSGSFA
jgi:hypothetical protein